ncbi:glycosyltransferase family 4 protein [Tenacibaculum agarivorans]|uniref:glycosyltransferase family 4 protein n=1 Tax=Tenacibaculum agarivorans TaxID=1908389 RepID=UPI00094B9B5F|nr:glycosyltransferase family 4 protein [Tenacibaculum agarivorans]
MIIIHLITAFGIGGAEKLLLNTINRQIINHEVHLIYLKPINELVTSLDSRVKKSYIPLSFSTIHRLRMYFKQTKPQVIHTHLSHADILGIFASIGNKAKVFCTMHNVFFKKNIMDHFLFFIYKCLFKIKKTHVISISKSVEDHVVNKLKQSSKRSYLLYNAIPFEEVSFQEEKKENNNLIHILFVGRLVKQKSVETLLKSIANLKKEKIKLTIVGDGILKDKLEKMTKQLNINDKVIFVGSRKNVKTYFKNADVFVLPSVWEGFGIVILEAFRSKLAVIATNIEGPSELIEHKKNGILFTPKDDTALTKELKELINNSEIRNKLATQGYISFTEKYHINTYVEQLEKIYIDESINKTNSSFS